MPRAAEQQLAQFVARFSPEMATLIRAARAKMRKLILRAPELAYDSCIFFVIGYGHNERPATHGGSEGKSRLLGSPVNCVTCRK